MSKNKLYFFLSTLVLLTACNDNQAPPSTTTQVNPPTLRGIKPSAALPTIFTVSGNALISRVKDYYNESQNYPYNQSKFGICASASLNSIMGYILYKNTNYYSLANFTALAYKYPLVTESPTYLFGKPNIGLVFDYLTNTGLVVRDNTINEQDYYVTLYAQYESVKESGYPDLINTSIFSNEVNNIQQYRVESISVRNIESPGLLGSSTESNSARLAYTLDNGYLVQFMIYPINICEGLQYKYSYNTTTHQLKLTSNFMSESNNTWTTLNPTTKGFNLGSEHWIYVFAYATATTGQKIFFVRNSWGDSRGENGNYFMTESFLDNNIIYNGDSKPLVSNFIRYRVTK